MRLAELGKRGLETPARVSIILRFLSQHVASPRIYSSFCPVISLVYSVNMKRYHCTVYVLQPFTCRTYTVSIFYYELILWGYKGCLETWEPHAWGIISRWRLRVVSDVGGLNVRQWQRGRQTKWTGLPCGVCRHYLNTSQVHKHVWSTDKVQSS